MRTLLFAAALAAFPNAIGKPQNMFPRRLRNSCRRSRRSPPMSEESSPSPAAIILNSLF